MNEEPNNPAGSDDVLRAGGQTEHGQQDAGGDEAGHGDADGMKTAELFLPYLDPIDDMQHCMDNSPTCLDGLAALAKDMDWIGETLWAVKDAFADQEFSISIEYCHILVRGPAAVIDGLIDKGHLKKWPHAEEAEDAPNDDNVASTAERNQHDAGRNDVGHHAPDGGRGDETTMAELDLCHGYPGDDLRECLEETGNLPAALATYASFMDEAAKKLRYLKQVLVDRHVKIAARVRDIVVEGPAAVIDDLIECGALKEPAWLAAAEKESDESPRSGAKTVQVRWKDHDAQIDEELAPLMLELWKADLKASYIPENTRSEWVQLDFCPVRDAELFLNIVAEYEDTSDSLYNRAQDAWVPPYEDLEGAWEFRVWVDDMAVKKTEADGKLNEVCAGPRDFVFSLAVLVPRSDFPKVLDRMKRHNEKNESSPESK